MRLLHYRAPVPNFGDDLNEVLWPALAPQLFSSDHPPGTAGHADAGTAAGAGEARFVGIGTIIGMPLEHSGMLHVFSSGVGYAMLDGWRRAQVRYHCVRGPVSARVLGLPADRALTDGAILAPWVPEIVGRVPVPGGVVVVPHFETVACPGWNEAARHAGMTLVDPRDSPQQVIAALRGARLVLTESLHGAILADTFDIPWRPFAVSRNFSTAKWADWAASLGLEVEVTMLAPPDPLPLLRFGRRAEPFGSAIKLEAESALAEYRSRVSHGPARNWQAASPRQLAKALLQRVPPVRVLLGFSADRTAEQLVHLAQGQPYLSPAALRDSLRSAMAERLQALVREEAGADKDACKLAMC